MYAEVLKIFNKYGVQETLAPYWDRYLSKHLINEVYFGYSYVDRDNLYQFPDVQALEGKKIILYGAGKVGYNYYKQLHYAQMGLCNENESIKNLQAEGNNLCQTDYFKA